MEKHATAKSIAEGLAAEELDAADDPDRGDDQVSNGGGDFAATDFALKEDAQGEGEECRAEEG